VAKLYTIGHSTHPIDEFIAILQAHGIILVADVRTVPRSRSNPQFNRETMPASLAGYGIGYEHRKALGGLRKPRADSRNTAWRNLSFRGYADHMLTDEFAAALRQLIDEAASRRTAVMCAEAVPWRCHRSMIADAFVAAGHEAVHIMSATKSDPHRLTSFAVVEGGRVWYPG
jgi:uncharacterized protein (DUF488 family)